MSILVGIPTYRRPDSLRRLLQSLVASLPSEGVEVCVVDNDHRRSALPVIEEFRGVLPITYKEERETGVVHVRNALVAHAMVYDALVFVDDDEWVSVGWFQALEKVHRMYPDAVVAGPVRYVLPDSSPSVLRDGDFFARPEHDDLATLSVTGTGNSLIPRDALESLDVAPFDTAFATIGGEDTDFFLRLSGSGRKIRWAAEAVVYEEIADGEATMVEVVRRYRRAGYVRAVIAARTASRLQLLLGGLARILLGLAKYSIRKATMRPLRARDIATFHGGRGYLDSALGRELQAYGGEP